MKTSTFISIIMLVFLCSCTAPINLVYDSARTIDKGNVEFRGSYSIYRSPFGDLFNLAEPGKPLGNKNFGFEAGYGITDRYTLKVRYENLSLINFNKDYFLDLEDLSNMNYYGIENKYKFRRANVAIGLPLGYYKFRAEDATTKGYFNADPMIYITLIGSPNKYELSIIPKIHVYIIDSPNVSPALSIGLGISNDLEKWALRPEVGFDGYFSFGLGFNVNLSKSLGKNKQ